jgi:hypothetical protein
MVDEEMAYLSDIIDLFLPPARLGRRSRSIPKRALIVRQQARRRFRLTVANRR